MLNRLGTEGSDWCQWGRIPLRQLQKQLRPCVIWNLFASCWILTGPLFEAIPAEKEPHTCVTRNERVECHVEATCVSGTDRGTRKDIGFPLQTQAGSPQAGLPSPRGQGRSLRRCREGWGLLLVSGLADRTIRTYWQHIHSRNTTSSSRTCGSPSCEATSLHPISGIQRGDVSHLGCQRL